MEKRRRKLLPSVPDPKGETKKSDSQVTFSAFLAKCVREGKLKFWQEKEIAIFFKDLGLREKEDLEIYEETLKKY